MSGVRDFADNLWNGLSVRSRLVRVPYILGCIVANLIPGRLFTNELVRLVHEDQITIQSVRRYGEAFFCR